eukprot:gene9399-6730_t
MRTRLQQDGPQETTRLLADSVRLARDAEHIGNVTLEELQRQGDSLEDSRQNLLGIQDMTSSAHESVRQLRAKLFQRKFMLGSVIVFLFLIIVSMLFTMYKHGGSLIGR